MQLEDYFEFEKLDTRFGEVERIRLKGTRIDIETIIRDYEGGHLAEQIVADYQPSLTLEQVYATLTYYLRNQSVVKAYMKRGEAIGEAYFQEYLTREPSEVVKRLKALKAQREQATAPQ